MLKADLMLVLNETLQKTGKKVNICFFQVRYVLSGVVFVLLIKKTNAGLLIPRLSNAFIQARKIIDTVIIRVKVLKYQQCLKIHGISLDKYLDNRKIELVK